MSSFRLPEWLARLTGAAAMIALAAAFALSSTAVPASASSASASAAGAQPGYVRVAHLSPNTPAMDVYLYSYGDPSAPVVLRDVAYGAVSAYQPVAAGTYTVAMRAAGAPATSRAAVSTTIDVHSGAASTVAAIGPLASLRLTVLADQITAPRGKALVRVIQASTSQRSVTVTAGSTVLGSDLGFAAVTPYGSVHPGTLAVRAAGNSENGTVSLTVAPDTVYSVVVLDKPGGLVLTPLTDSAGMAAMPTGGAQTGFGGTAPHPGTPLPLWLAIAGLVLAGATAAAARPRRGRRRAGTVTR